MILFALAAPGSLFGSDKSVDELKSLLSWSVALQMTGETWLSGAAPAPYVRNACEHGREAIAKKSADLRKRALPPAARDPLQDAAGQMEKAARELATAVKANDRISAAVAVDEMKAAHAAIRAALALATQK